MKNSRGSVIDIGFSMISEFAGAVLLIVLKRKGRYDDSVAHYRNTHTYPPYFVAEPATLALSTLSLVTCFPRMFL
jgi:hypothetical protein